MHELSIAQGVLSTVLARAEGRRIVAVRLAVGALSGVDAVAVAACFALLVEGTPHDGARLLVDEVAGVGRCDRCGRVAPLEAPLLQCGCAPDARLRVVRGEELTVRSMEVQDV